MPIEILHRHTRAVLFSSPADTIAGAVQEAIKTRADLSGADLRGADLVRADLSGADLRGADLGGADLSEADLGGADLRGAYLSEADLGGADLGGAYLGGVLAEHCSRILTAASGSGYQMVFVRHSDGVSVHAGCRNVPSLAEARAHWREGESHAPDHLADCIAALDYLEALAKRRGWDLGEEPGKEAVA